LRVTSARCRNLEAGSDVLHTLNDDGWNDRDGVV
jgi:hypothetical protein